MERDNVFSLQDYLAVLRRQRGLIALIAVFAAVGGATWFLLQTPTYEAQAELALERVRAAQDVSLNELLNPAGNVLDTDVDGATSATVAQSAAELLGRDDPSQLRTQVRAESVSDDRILRITATDADPVTAAQIADAFATSFIEYRRQEAVDTVLLTQGELDQRASEIRDEISRVDAQIAALDIPAPVAEDEAADGETADGETAEEDAAADAPAREPSLEELDELETLQIRRNALRTQLSQVIARSTELGESADALTGFAADFTAASIPNTPVGNTLLEVVGVAFFLGLALGIALAFVRDHFDDVIRDEDDFKRASEGRPVLGRIPIWKPRDNDTERVASIVDPTSSAAEAYRELSAGVRFLLVAQADEPEYDATEHHGLTRSRSVMVCSANIGEGKTETAANLAVAAARVGLRTVLVDADLRRPAVAKRFGLGRTTGLSDALLNGESAEAHMVDVGVDDLYVLPAGTIPPNPAELLASPAMRAMQQGLLRKYDLVVIDTPAVLAVPDALEIGPYVDLAVLVGRVGQTGRRRLGAAMERLGQVGAAVSGTVLNGLDRASDGYYYAYAYQETPEKTGRRQTRKERKAAEREAKASAKQAKIDAKQEKRANKRRGRGRRGSDDQVDHTLRQVEGATPVTVVEPAAVDETADPVAATPEPEVLVAEPDPQAAEAEPLAAEAEPVAAEPEPVAEEPEPVAAEPEPEAGAIEPDAADGDAPEAAEPEHETEAPEAAADEADAEPAPEPEPEPVEARSPAETVELDREDGEADVADASPPELEPDATAEAIDTEAGPEVGEPKREPEPAANEPDAAAVEPEPERPEPERPEPRPRSRRTKRAPEPEQSSPRRRTRTREAPAGDPEAAATTVNPLQRSTARRASTVPTDADGELLFGSQGDAPTST